MRRALAIPMDDTTSAMLRFRSGPSGHVATLMATAWTWQLRVFGVRGYAVMPDETSLQIVERSGVSRHVAFPVLDTERAELEAFAGLCGETRPTRSPSTRWRTGWPCSRPPSRRSAPAA